MGKRGIRKDPKLSEAKNSEAASQNVSTAVAIDPTLDALFKSSLTESTVNLKRQIDAVHSSTSEEVVSEPSSSSGSSPSLSEHADEQTNQDARSIEDSATSRPRKRKREDEDVEHRYLNRLAKEQQREEAKRQKASSQGSHSDDLKQFDGEENTEDSIEEALTGVDEELPEVPQHEVFSAGATDTALEKAKRTVFLSNVSTTAISSKASQRLLLKHLVSFVPQLPEADPPHKVESLRFRSTAYSLVGIPKRAAFAKKKLMEATTKSSNAYVVYSTSFAAREAVKRLNGTVVLDRHIRVDSVAHPAPIDHHRCVFVANLGYVDDESLVENGEEGADGRRSKKTRPPADVEEGLWRQFLKVGQVESVRVIRDPETRVGKGFAYVQFTDGNAVERALTYHDKRFPPLLPRPLRVVRAKHPSKTASSVKKRPQAESQRPQGVYNPKHSAEAQSLAGRARKLFGKGGAARLAHDGKIREGTATKRPESFVFEGHRARPGQGASVLKGAKKGRGKPNTRSSRRGAAFKAAGGKKSRKAP